MYLCFIASNLFTSSLFVPATDRFKMFENLKCLLQYDCVLVVAVIKLPFENTLKTLQHALRRVQEKSLKDRKKKRQKISLNNF